MTEGSIGGSWVLSRKCDMALVNPVGLVTQVGTRRSSESGEEAEMEACRAFRDSHGGLGSCELVSRRLTSCYHDVPTSSTLLQTQGPGSGGRNPGHYPWVLLMMA